MKGAIQTAITFEAVSQTESYKASVKRAGQIRRKLNILDNWARKKRRKTASYLMCGYCRKKKAKWIDMMSSPMCDDCKKKWDELK